jgi:hypothetical protein
LITFDDFGSFKILQVELEAALPHQLEPSNTLELDKKIMAANSSCTPHSRNRKRKEKKREVQD